MKQEDIKVNMPVLYVKGNDHYELGIVKRLTPNGAFVRYHMGDTAANTPAYLLQPLQNSYAFQIIRKDVNNDIETSHALQLAVHIVENLEGLVSLGMLELKDSDADAIIKFIATTIEQRENKEGGEYND